MSCTDKSENVLVIGMGNVLMQDEGVGVRAVEELECRYITPKGVTVIDGGTTGMELFEPIRGCDRLIVADAVNTGDPPGTVVRIVNDAIPAFFQTKLSNHQLGLSDLLALLTLKGQLPKQIAIIGMVPYSLENRLGLTPESSAGLDRMVELLVAELAGLGIQLQQRDSVRTGSWRREAERELSARCA